MVAVGIAVIAAVVLLTGGVVADSTEPDSLTFFDVSVRATSAQVFLTGALCTWMLFAAVWLLMSGMRRSRLRSAELAEARRLRREHRRGTLHSADRLAEPEGWAGDEVHADRAAVGRIPVGQLPLGQIPIGSQIPVGGVPLGSASIGFSAAGALGAPGIGVSGSGSVHCAGAGAAPLDAAGERLFGGSGLGDGDDAASGQQPAEKPPGGH